MYQLPPSITLDSMLMYLRKSRTDDPALSVEDVLSKHEQMLDEWAVRTFGATVPAAARYREVVSGETISARPQMQRLLREIESPRYNAVLTVEPQRLSRGDLEDAGYLMKILRYTNTLVITPVFTYDLSDERDRDLFQRELQRGNEFLEYQKRIMNRGRLLAVENGCYIGNTAPYGYDKTCVRIGKRTCYTLKPNPDTAPVVRLIYDLYLQGMGNLKIADYLEAHGIPSPSGRASWTPCVITGILTNPHYIGKVRWNRRKTVRAVEDGELVTRRPRAEDCLIYDGLHDPIVDPEVYARAQAQRGHLPKNPSRRSLANPLAGLLYCRCGRVMIRQPYRNGEARINCTGQRVCRTPSALFDAVVDAVASSLRSTIEDFELRIAAGEDRARDTAQQTILLLERRCQELSDTELKQWELYSAGKMPQNIFDRLNAKVLAERAGAEAALAEAKAAPVEETSLTERVTTFRAALDALLNPDVPAREKNRLLHLCIERITYSREGSASDRTWSRTSARPTPISLDIKYKV